MSSGGDSSGVLFSPMKKYSSLSDWASIHPHISGFLSFLTHNVIGSPISGSKMSVKRAGIHARIKNAVLNHIENIESKLAYHERELGILSQTPYTPIGFLCFENNSDNLYVRKLTFVQRMIHKKRISIITAKYSKLSDILAECRSLMNLYTADIIPNDVICKIDESFFAIEFGSSISNDEIVLKRLESHSFQLEKCIRGFPEPQWASDYTGFLKSLIASAMMHLDSEVSYFYFLESEIQLSRYFFNSKSQSKSKIDEYLRSVGNYQKKQEFAEGLVDLCYQFMPSSGVLSLDEQSTALLLLYRSFFNRLYEKNSSLFIPQNNSVFCFLENVKVIRADSFPLPLDMVSGDPTKFTIKELFTKDPYFYAASQFLSLSLFQSNPIDALYYVHKCLIGIHKGALINRLGGSHASVEDVNQLLCFDDLFSLLFGTLLASDYHDVFFLSSFIENYAPIQCLSPPFEYAQANLEALVVHCRKTDVIDFHK